MSLDGWLDSLPQQALDRVLDIVLGFDPQGQIIYANQTACSCLGHGRETLLGSHLSTIDTHISLENWPQIWQQLCQWQSFTHETQYARRDGQYFPVEVSVHHLHSQGQDYGLVFSHNISEQKLLQSALLDGERQLRRHNQALLELTSSEVLGRGDLPAGLQLITETAAQTLELARAGVWLYRDAQTLEGRDVYDARHDRHDTGALLHAQDCPGYFQSLGQVIPAHRAQSDPRTRDLTAVYLQPGDIRSLLAVPVWAGGQLVGVLTLEQVGTVHHWSLEEEHFASALANLVSMALAFWERRQAQVELEERILERTAALSEANQILLEQISERQRAETSLRLSEARFRSLVEQAADAIFLYDLDGQVIDANRQACELLGYSHTQLRQSTVSHLHPQWCPDHWQGLIPGEPRTIEGCAQHRDGGRFPVELSVGRLQLGEESYILSLVRDIRQRKRVEADLQQAKEAAEKASAYLATVIDHLADGLLVTDSEGRIARYNPALAGLLALATNDETLPLSPEMAHLQTLCSGRGSPYIAVAQLHPAIQELIQATLQNAAGVHQAEIPLAGQRVGKAVATAIHPQQFTCIGAVILIRDITADKELDQMKTDFISTVSHELRTPLTSVLGFAKIIQKKLDDTLFPEIHSDSPKVQRTMKQIEENLRIIITEGGRLTSLINDVLDIAKMESGKSEWHWEWLDINDLIRHAAAATDSLFTAKQLPLILDLAADLPQIQGDRDRLIQVLINLISNAVKFTDDGAVTCRSSLEQGQLVIQVRDTGMGIAPGDQEKIFEKFKQVGNTLTDKPQGTGLGLAICRHIIEHHGGQIGVVSELGKGSSFWFHLPVGVVPEPVVLDVDALVQQLREQVVPLPAGMAATKHILIVDDDTHIRELLKQELTQAGYHVQEARNGVEAIKQVGHNYPDLIILDVMMPEVNGFDVAAALKNNPTTANIPIIILSIVEDRQKGYRLGVDRYITKPFLMDNLLQEVNHLLAQGSERKKILVVSQHQTNLKCLTQALENQGDVLIEVTSPELASAQVQRFQPDMIIMDTLDAQGYQLARDLRLKQGLENVFFMLVTDQGSPGQSG
ncbi:ATPase, histidine kinase-, DNA gyrase B-, and HSP90-like domain protein [Gloeomargarita lithophora Alchichica-D10]|uniref:Circadian input-output histidine kinase CikA n=1 Tax=Gloeomargarita lithophora Alchichica-D10 TaxID=1188229 RepID=A0A1J0AE19_9CYAN|nr:PAS domain S-box protein [Gloeomargarita lithophora]APB34180.1 ATPase, histidine kinase-, DNA gyrase B-, and HSP90-like domain protein [Gloeomargarita lithophora Alchichica-D10]